MPKFETDPKKRFSSRVENYIKYRPNYPSEIISFLKKEIALDDKKIIADVGSGTGILTELFLKNRNIVYAIEPNNEMREGGEKILSKYSNFKSTIGTAEKTNLDSNSIDIITAAQAFHWFNIEEAKKEFKRILKPDGWTVLLWNTRMNNSSLFMEAYENFLLENSVDYNKVSHTNIDEKKLKLFFSDYKTKVFPNRQSFDFGGLKGRVLSSSYMPMKKDKRFNLMMNSLKNLFNNYNENGLVEFIYRTEVYYGKI